MTIKDLQMVISSATTVKVYATKSKEDAANEKYETLHLVDVYSCITGMEDWEIDYIYPREKDVLEAWCVIGVKARLHKILKNDDLTDAEKVWIIKEYVNAGDITNDEGIELVLDYNLHI